MARAGWTRSGAHGAPRRGKGEHHENQTPNRRVAARVEPGGIKCGNDHIRVRRGHTRSMSVAYPAVSSRVTCSDVRSDGAATSARGPVSGLFPALGLLDAQLFATTCLSCLETRSASDSTPPRRRARWWASSTRIPTDRRGCRAGSQRARSAGPGRARRPRIPM